MDETSVRVEARAYAVLPRLGRRTVVALYRSLAAALPRRAPSAVVGAAQRCAERVRAVQAAADADRRQRVAAKAAQPLNLRVVDNRADAVVAALSQRLEAYQAVAFHDAALAEEASQMRARLFPEGTGFLRSGAHAQWEATEALLRDLAAHEDEARLRALVGDTFVDALHAAHTLYGKALGVTEPRPATTPTATVKAPLAAAVSAMEDLVLQVVAAVNDEGAPLAQRVALRGALAAVDDLRARQAASAGRGAAADEGDDEPDNDPLPDVT